MDNIFLPKKHVVMYIDLLGVKDRIVTDTKGALAESLSWIFSNFYKCITGIHEEKYLKIKVFSDNIIIARGIENEELNQRINLSQMIALAESFQWLSIFRSGILVRGGITIGDLYIDDTFVIGKALLDVYNLEKNVAVYPRIIIDDSILNLVAENAHVCRDFDGKTFVDFLSMAANRSTEKTILERYMELLDIFLAISKEERIIEKLNWCIKYRKEWMDRHYVDS